MFKAAASANHWKNFYLNALTKETSFPKLTAIKQISAETIPAEECFHRAAREQGAVFLLTVAPSKTELQLFHQPAVIGGSIANSTTHFVALYGFDSAANVVEFDTSSITPVNLKTPKWEAYDDAVNDVSFLDDVQDPTDENVSCDFTGKNLLILPLSLAIAFLQAPTRDPVSVAQALAKMMAVSDAKQESTEASENVETFRESFQHAIQFCWAAAKSKINPVQYWISEAQDALDWV